MYGALILEPTIPSTVPVCEKYEDLDDFWLDLAKGQTLKQTNFHQSVGPSVSLQQKHAQTDFTEEFSIIIIITTRRVPNTW
jgi:hypothetical protein